MATRTNSRNRQERGQKLQLRHPKEGLVGAHQTRRTPRRNGEVEGREPVGAGAQTAPTRRAEMRERVRHSKERQMGRVAAGTGGKLRDTRRKGVTREMLKRARDEADAAVKARRTPATRIARKKSATGKRATSRR